MWLAMALGSLIASMLDVIVFVPAVVVGAPVPNLRSGMLAWALLLVAVLAIKRPAILDMADRLDRATKPLIASALAYGVALALIMGLVGLCRRAMRGVRRPDN